MLRQLYSILLVTGVFGQYCKVRFTASSASPAPSTSTSTSSEPSTTPSTSAPSEPSTTPSTSAPSEPNPNPSAPTKNDFKKLRLALATQFVTTQNIPKLVRMTFHDLMNFDKQTGSAGAQGCIFDQQVASFSQNNGLGATVQALKSFVDTRFPNIKFSSGDIASLAGKVAIEKAYPCIRIRWSFGRKSCTQKELELGPKPNISSLPELQPFLNRYGLSSTDMATLIIGGHAVAGSMNRESDSGIFSFSFAGSNSGVDFIQKTVGSQLKTFGDWIGLNVPDVTASATLGRFPCDMMFFPSANKKIQGAPVDHSTEIANVEKTLLSFTDLTFNKAFATAYSKSLLIGTDDDNLTLFESQSVTC